MPVTRTRRPPTPAVFPLILCVPIPCLVGCAPSELREPTRTFTVHIASRPCPVEVAARRTPVRQTLNYRTLPPQGEAFVALHRQPGVIRWNSRNLSSHLDGAFLDSAGRVLACFTTVPLSRVDHVSPPEARALLLARPGFIRHTKLVPGTTVSLPPAVWAYARTCWDADDAHEQAQWRAIGYRPIPARWGRPEAPSPASPPR